MNKIPEKICVLIYKGQDKDILYYVCEGLNVDYLSTGLDSSHAIECFMEGLYETFKACERRNKSIDKLFDYCANQDLWEDFHWEQSKEVIEKHKGLTKFGIKEVICKHVQPLEIKIHKNSILR